MSWSGVQLPPLIGGNLKTYKHLYHQICSFENLLLAFQKARRGKSSKPYVAAFEYELEHNLFRLQETLLDGTYHPGSYHNFYVYEPKRRLISAAPFRDRVAHHALVNVIEPIWERRFIHDSYACRKGKGTHRAIVRASGFARKYRFMLKADVVKFFPSVDHAILLRLLARCIADERALELCRRILASGEGVQRPEYPQHYFPGDDLFALLRPRGLPIGNLTSQFWANVYLSELDHFVKRQLRCQAYLRYADDVLLFGNDKAQLWAWREQMAEFVARLRLRLHERKSVVFPVTHGIPWLGFRIFPAHRKLKRENVRRQARRLARLQEAYARREVSREHVTASLQSWIAHASWGDTYRLRVHLLRDFALVSTR